MERALSPCPSTNGRRSVSNYADSCTWAWSPGDRPEDFLSIENKMSFLFQKCIIFKTIHLFKEIQILWRKYEENPHLQIILIRAQGSLKISSQRSSDVQITKSRRIHCRVAAVVDIWSWKFAFIIRFIKETYRIHRNLSRWATRNWSGLGCSECWFGRCAEKSEIFKS